MTDTNTGPTQATPVPAPDHFDAALDAVGTLTGIKYDAVERINDARDILDHIHEIAVTELVHAKTLAEQVLPYTVTAIAFLSAGLLIGHFA